ncbi:MAG: UPF0182 family protein [Candidatus Schekmanbacteria bacterium]|nr:UPF0182 family protein [Candidatus Schekmanbacteria bacterium]
MRSLFILFVLIGIVIPVFFSGVDLLIDYLWFGQLGYGTIFTTSLFAKLAVGFSTGLLFMLLVSVSILFTRSKASLQIPKVSGNIIEFPEIERYREGATKISLIVTACIAYLIGGWGASHWEDYLKYKNSIPFGVSDPLYSRDIGFYIFELPFIEVVYQFLSICVVFSIIISAGLYLINRNIVVFDKGARLSTAAKRHFLILGALFFVTLALKFRIDVYNLLFSKRAIIFGAGYTDVHASLPVINIMAALSLAVAGVFIINIFFPLYKVLAGSAALLLVVFILGEKIYPEAVQKFQVAPNEIEKEREYIALAIKFTNAAYGIDKVDEKPFPASENLTSAEIDNNSITIKNIRLWDEAPLLATFAQLQEIRTYYDFVAIDNDRYMINGEYRQIALSPRELSYANLPSKIWINEHLTYTHGYGLCLGPVNQVTKEGLPEFFIKDIPPKSLDKIEVKRPEIYFGEIANDYCFVNTASKEFDYPSGDSNVYTNYAGTGGIKVKNFWQKILFALKFKELKIMLSGDISSDSRIMMYRGIEERVRHLTPFIAYDSDPYLVISKDGKLFWIIDGYTVTSNYPYSEPFSGRSNYIRNSVKTVVDAYNGTVDFYISDDKDPLIRMYSKIFPGVFKPLTAMPDDLKAHIRYPQDLFSIQAAKYAVFHMTDPQVFYNKEDLWKIPGTSTAQVESVMKPYYTIMKLASEEKGKEEYILMIPFTPSRKNNMIAWLAARCDAPNYGKLIVYDFPKQKLVYGPQQVESRIDQDPEISKQLTLWNQGGSAVIRGSLLVVPIEKSILYVQPLYLSSTQGGSLPELKRVLVSFENRIAMENTLELAMMKIFGEVKSMGEQGETVAQISSRLGPGTKGLIEKANELYLRSLDKLKSGDWSGYGADINELGNILRELKGTNK